MNETEVKKIEAKVQRTISSVIEAFRKQDEEVEVPVDVKALTRELTTELVQDFVDARNQEVDLAELNLKGKSKASDWKAYRESRKKDIERTHKALKRYVMKPNDEAPIPVAVGVDPSEGVTPENNEGVS